VFPISVQKKKVQARGEGVNSLSPLAGCFFFYMKYANPAAIAALAPRPRFVKEAAALVGFAGAAPEAPEAPEAAPLVGPAVVDVAG